MAFVQTEAERIEGQAAIKDARSTPRGGMKTFLNSRAA
jgi:hypothetical protein